MLNRAALKLTVGSNKPLKATTNPEVVSGPITWTSSNESVASVDQNGMVKAKAVRNGNHYSNSLGEIRHQPNHGRGSLQLRIHYREWSFDEL